MKIGVKPEKKIGVKSELVSKIGVNVAELVATFDTKTNPALTPIDTKLSKAGWRIEVKAHGKYYQYRKGSGRNKQSAYGGKFSQLSRERQEAYYKNVKSYARR